MHWLAAAKHTERLFFEWKSVSDRVDANRSVETPTYQHPPVPQHPRPQQPGQQQSASSAPGQQAPLVALLVDAISLFYEVFFFS